MGYRLSVLFLLVVASFSVVLLFMIFAPVTVIKPNIQPYEVDQKTVRQGESVTYVVDACKYMDVTSLVNRSIVIDGVIFDLPMTQNNISPGCNKSKVSVLIPNSLPAGKAYIELTVEYKINALRDQTYHFKTKEFTILPGEQ